MMLEATDQYLKDRFCAQPFEYMDVGRAPDNYAYVCCPAWLPVSGGKVGVDEPFEIWNSEKMQKIRSSIHEGTFEYCSQERCPKIQARRLPLKSEVRDPYLKKMIDEKKVVLEKGPRRLNLASDRSCNLSCPSCRTEKIMQTTGPLYENAKMSQDKLFDAFMPDLRVLTLTGSGDPFASRVYRDFLTSFDGKKNPQLKIEIITNGQLFDEHMWQKLEKVHDNIHYVAISFDAATPETYRKVRRGGELDNLVKNVRFLQSIRKAGAPFRLRLDFVVQALNYAEMPEFAKLGLEVEADEIQFQKIVSWDTYSPSEFEKQAIYLETHPQYSHFLEVLKDPILTHPKVNLGNVSEYRRKLAKINDPAVLLSAEK